MTGRKDTRHTHYIHRISYTTQERLVGTFVLVAIVILFWLMLSSGQTKNLFSEQLTFYGELDTNKAVNKDTEITIAGLSVGSVSSVDVNDFGQITITMRILEKYHSLLRTDSVATLRTPELAVLGDTVIDITPGTASLPLLLDGSTMRILEETSLKNVMDKVGPIFTSLEESIRKVDAILAQIDPVSFRETLDNMNTASANVAKIVDDVENGGGILSATIYDENMRKDIEITIANMQEASARVNELLEQVSEQVAEVPGLINKVEPLLEEADRTIKATQRIWPLSSAVGDDPDRETLTSPEPVDD